MTQGLVYKTTGGGQNWTAVWRGDNLARYVWIDPRDPRAIARHLHLHRHLSPRNSQPHP